MFQARNISKRDPKFSINGSSWKENLRERCRRRIKEERKKIYNVSRNLPSKEELKCYVLETIKEEWNELKEVNNRSSSSSTAFQHADIDEDSILRELEEELLLQEESECQELMSQYEMVEEEYDHYLEELQEDYVICPLCCRKKLVIAPENENVNLLTCSGDCSISKRLPYGMDEVRRRIDSAVKAHSNCPFLPGFTFTSTTADSSLYLACSECGTLYFVL